MGSSVPTTHLSSLLFSTTTTRREHYGLSQLAATSQTDKSSNQTRRNKKMCKKTEDAGETLGQDDNYAGRCQKSCHFDQVRLQREPEQPYCGICQAYVEKCVCKEPRPL